MLGDCYKVLLSKESRLTQHIPVVSWLFTYEEE
jgi:hypothetical protein